MVEMANHHDRIQRLRQLAEEVRTVAEGMRDLQYRRTMVLTAESYDQMAIKLAQHLSLPEEPSPGLSPESETSTVAEPK
jgi:predicted HAD superfamily phosphohydrolase